MHLLPEVLPYSRSTRVAPETSRKVCIVDSLRWHIMTIFAATQTILSKIPPNNSKLTYVWEQYLFHYVSEGGFTYLVMADDAAGR